MASSDVAALLAKDFVLLKIDIDRTIGGKDVLTRYRGAKESGIPWFVFTGEAGTALATSDAAKGNTGFPTDPWEIDHFISMLTTARVNLTDEEIAALRKSLEPKKAEAPH